MNKTLCIIPARSGSLRLKNKNFKKFNKKTLIENTIEAALKSKIFDKIVVSSDKNLKNLCKKYDVEFFLRDQFKGKVAPVSSATIYTLKKLNCVEEFKTVVQLMPSCPLRDEKDIISSYKNFKLKKNIFQISCFKISWLHFYWALVEKKNENKKFYFSKKKLNNKAQISFPTGAIWIANIKKLIQKKSFYNNFTKFYELNWINSIDIDLPEDFRNAKLLSKLK